MEIYVKNLTFTLYCGGVWAGGGNQCVARLVLTGCGIAVSAVFGAIREDSRRCVYVRISAHQIVSNRSLSLMGEKKYCLREQTHSSELQLVFVNHSQQIVLDRQMIRLCNKFSISSFRIRLISQIYSIRKASSNEFAYV